MKTKTNQKGFTIIEVVLVLAIAALIFLMIFIALPALQRGQRDTARKQDQNKVATALNTWRGNNRGSLPDFGTPAIKQTFIDDYIDKLGQYNSDATAIITNPTGVPNPDIEQIVIVTGFQCDDNGTGVGDPSSRSAAVFVRLEASNALVCADA